MKKLLSFLIALALIGFGTSSTARQNTYGQQVVYSGAAANLLISAVDGTAFVDNLPAEVVALADGTHELVVYDTAGRINRGVLKAAGTGETLGDESITTWTNFPGSTYETLTLSGTDITSAINDSGTATASTGSIFTNLGLYKYSFNMTVNSGTVFWRVGAAANPGTGSTVFFTSASGVRAGYYTPKDGATYTYSAFRVDAAANFSSTSNTVKQVLTPSASGATIQVSKWDATENWNKNPNFTYNSASYWIQIRRIR